MSPRKDAAAEPIGALSLRGWAAEAEAAAGIAKALAGTAFVPDHLRVWTNPAERDPSKRVLDYENTVAQVTAVLLAGQELEFGPMASLRAFVIIRGTVALYAIAARALLQRHGHEIVVVESNSSRAIVRGLRAGSDHWQESTWDLDRAKTAGLYPGHVDGNWRRQTKAMLVARATAEVARWVASDAMLGLPLIAEEVEDAEVEISPDGDGAAPATPAAPTNRRRGGPRAMLPVSAGLVSPAPPPPPPEGSSSSQPPPGVPRATKAMIAKLHAGLKALQITGPDEGLALVSMWAGRKIDNTQHLTRDEIRVALERIDALREAARADHADADVPHPRPPGDDEPETAEQPGDDHDDKRGEEPPDDAEPD
jgi:hypothetical protein